MNIFFKHTKILALAATTLTPLSLIINSGSAYALAEFEAIIEDFSLVMPAAIENKFGFSLSLGTVDPLADKFGNATVGVGGSFSQTQQPSELPSPPFSAVRGGREGTIFAVGTADKPLGGAFAKTTGNLFGRLGNLTGTGPGSLPPENIELNFDLSFSYSLLAKVDDPPNEDAYALFSVMVNGLGTPDAGCTPLSDVVVAPPNSGSIGNVTCVFSTTLAPNEFRDFSIDLLVEGVALSEQPPAPPIPPPVPPKRNVKGSLLIDNPKDEKITVEIRGTVQLADGTILDAGQLLSIMIPPGGNADLDYDIPIPDFLTDIEYIIDDPGVISNTKLGFISGLSDSLFLENYADSIQRVGEFIAPLLFSQDGLTDIFIGIDLNQWINSEAEFEIGQTFDFIDGFSSELPGVIAGFSEILFSPSEGFFTENPATIQLVATAKADGKTVPEPTSTLSLLALGTLGAASTLKRKLKPSKSTEKETTKVG
jgi:hypothetical protein